MKHLLSIVALYGFVAGSALAGVSVSNLDQADAGQPGPSFGIGFYNGPGSTPTVVGLTVQTGSAGLDINGVTIQISDVRFGSPTGELQVDIYTTFTFGVGPSGLVGSFSSPANPVTAGLYTYTGNAALSANTTYYLFLRGLGPYTNADVYEWTRTLSSGEDAASLAGWSLGNGYYLQSNDFPTWTFFGGSAPKLALNNAVPEPSTWALMALGVVFVGCCVMRRKAA